MQNNKANFLKNTTKVILVTAGFIELVLGLVHFTFPDKLNYLNDLVIDPNEIDFIILNITGLGISLVVFGALTIFFTIKLDLKNKALSYFAFFQMMKYLTRISIPAFFINNINFLLRPIPIVLFGLFTFSMILIFICRKYSY